MKNELGRKITSLTIMTIMVAGGMTFAIPEVMPEAAASDERLMYVSAENSLFGNTFAGGQIVEIIVRDPARDETDENQSEPTIKINGETLRTVQGDDGYWYAYIGSTNSVADAHSAAGGEHNIDYGTALTAGIGPQICGATCRDSLDTTLSISPDATVYINDYAGAGEVPQMNGRINAPDLSAFLVSNDLSLIHI